MQPASASKIYLKKNLSLAWPLALNALLMQSMLVIDTLLVSPLGEMSVAAAGIATTIIAFFLGVQMALANGSQLLIGRAFGAKNQRSISQSAIYGLMINAVFSLGCLSLLTFCRTEIISLVTDDKQLAELIVQYLSIAQYILLFNGVTQSFIALLNASGNTQVPLRVYMLELPFNTIISYMLIFGMGDMDGLGLIGAAWGSFSAIILRFVLLLYYICRHSMISLSLLSGLNHKKGVVEHFNEIFPIATNFVVLSVGHTVYQLLFAQLNIYSYVAVTLIFPWLKMATLFIVSWAQANSISLSQAIGKGLTKRIKPVVQTCIWAGIVMSCGLAIILYLFSLSIEWIYPNVTAQTYSAIETIAPLFIALPLVRTFNTIAGNSLRAIGKSVQVLKIHFITQWLIILPLCAWFVLYLELPLFWAFGLLLLEEIIKSVPFFLMLKKHALDV